MCCKIVCRSEVCTADFSSEEELYEFKAEMKYGKHGFGAEMSRDEEHRHSAAHVRLEVSWFHVLLLACIA